VEVIEYPIEHTSPLLMHNPAGMKVMGEVMAKKKIPTQEEEAAAGVYRLPSGQLYMPNDAFRSALVKAGSGRKIGKTFVTTIVKGAVFSATDAVPITSPDGTPITTWDSIDVRRVIIGKAGILRARPRIEKWAAVVPFEIDTEMISPELVEELLDLAGRLVGVGDYRPEKSGPFGRFRVVNR
jgi:hypothetical protein